MGRRAVLAVGTTVALLLLLPAFASANWTHKGKGELKEDASVTLGGTLTLATGIGNVSCTTELGVTLTKSGSAGDVNSFTVSKPSECDLSGALGTVCGTHGLTKVERTGTWSFAADESDITLSSIDVHYIFSGCAIPALRLKGSSTLSVDKASAIGSTTFGGEQTLYNVLGEELDKGKFEDTLAMSPAGTYGVKTAPTVETKWTDGDKHLSEDGKLTLTGNFSFSGTGGSVTCPATVKSQLESSTVEEEESEGEIESFTVSKPSECDVGGTLGTQCGTHSVASVEQTGIATLNATEEDFSIAGLALDYKFSACAVTSLRVEGNPTVAVDDAGSIGEASFSAGSLQLYNAAAEKIGTAEAGGAASASPSGTYQLASDAAETEATETEAEETEVEATEAEATETEETDTPPALELDGEWYTNSEIIGNKENDATVPFTGSLSMVGLGGLLNIGPCDVHASVTVWNEEGHATGRVESFTITTQSSIPPKTCGVVVAGKACDTANAGSLELPWHLDTDVERNITITNAAFFNVYTAECPVVGGKTVAAFGDLTGEFSEGCIYFENSGDLAVPGNGPITITGEVCS